MSKSKNNSLVGFIAFVAILLAGVLFLVLGINNLVNGKINGDLIRAIELVATCCLFFVAALAAYRYVEGRATWMKVVYFVVIIVFILSRVFNIINI